MSFYTDDFYQDEGGTPVDGDDAPFLCVNCGGTDSYLDTTTGLLCCSSCYTQSQTQQADHEALDLEEVQGLAARTRGGRFKSVTRSSKGRGGGRKRKKQPLSELDTSVAFPNLATCLHGIQRVLQEGSDCVCDLAGIQDEQQRQSVKKTVHDLWSGYLVAWTDGAEYYGKLHPEVRFSLRDAFVTRHYKNLVMKHLSHTCIEALKKESEETKQASADDLDNSSDAKDVIAASPPDTDRSAEEDDTAGYKYQRNYSKIMPLLKLYGKKGRKEAALRLQPSMTLCASILWLAVSRAGVTCKHITSWIANGSLPLLNAFSLLNEKERAALKPIANVFQLQNVPSTRLVEFYAELLVAACGLKSYQHLVKTKNDVAVSKTDGPKVRIKRKAADANKRTKIRLLHPDSVPLMTARLVSDLGLGQVILDTSLALMGCAVDAKRNDSSSWLPACLDAARPENITSPAHVLGVICVACKMCGKWESWAYRRPMCGNKRKSSEQKAGSVQNVESSNTDNEGGRKKPRKGSTQDRLVPWNEQQFRLVGNGAMLEGYLDFIEEVYLDQAEELSEYRDILSSTETHAKTGQDQTSKSAVRPNSVLVGGHPNRPSDTWRPELDHDWHVESKGQKALWADVNGSNEYVVYNDRKDPRPVQTHYRLLLEYMAYKADVEPSDIDAVVGELEEQVAARVLRKHSAERKRKVGMDKEAPKKRRQTGTNVGKEKEKGDKTIDIESDHVSEESKPVASVISSVLESVDGTRSVAV